MDWQIGTALGMKFSFPNGYLCVDTNNSTLLNEADRSETCYHCYQKAATKVPYLQIKALFTIFGESLCYLRQASDARELPKKPAFQNVIWHKVF
jgi:hypothetical protein